MLTSKLYGDTDARLAISVDVVGLSYDSATGVLTVAAGYAIPSDEQVAEWAAAASALATHTADTDIHFAQGDIAIQASQVSDFATAADARIEAQKATANGLATLDAGGKVPVAQLPSSVMQYQGVWDASTNTPTLVDGTGDTGDVYRVTVAGSQDLGSGVLSFEVGDYAIYNGATWEKSDTTDAVASVNGLTGVVTLDTDNIDEGSTNQYFTQARARAAISNTIAGLDYNSTTGVWSLATGYVIPTTIDESNWNTAYGWGNHAGLYDAAGTAASAVTGHTNDYNHSLIATAVQTETDPVVGAVDGIVKSDGDGNISAAVAGADYLSESSQVQHNETAGYKPNEHIDWTEASDNFYTVGTGFFGGALTVLGQPAPGDEGLDNAVTRRYVESRGMNLVTNGSGLMRSNYNFSWATFDPAETHGGGGSFLDRGIRAFRRTDELIPVDPHRKYLLTAWLKAGNDDGTEFTEANQYYLAVVEHDADGLIVDQPHCYKFPTAVDTTLAADLKPGDTTITLTDATGWCNDSTANGRILAWYPYTNAKGYTYPAYTYTRNVAGRTADGLWPPGGVSGNVITLNAPWSGQMLPAGTKVRNARGVGAYKYKGSGALPNEWTRWGGVIGGVMPTPTSDSNSVFRTGTAYIKIGFLLNYHGVADACRVSDVWFGEVAELYSADGTPGATKDVIITAGQNVTLHFKNGLFVGSD